MENNIDKLFREGLSRKGTPFNENAWDRLVLPEQERSRRIGLWWWFGIAAIMFGLIVLANYMIQESHIIDDPVKKEFATISDEQDKSNYDSPESNINSESSTISREDENLISNVIPGSELNTTAVINEEQEEDPPIVIDINKIKVNKKPIHSDLTLDDSAISAENELPEDETIIKKESIVDPRALVLISPLNNPDLYLGSYDRIWDNRLSDEYRIEPLKGINKWVIGGLAEASHIGSLGGGISLSWKGSSRIFFRSAILYKYQSEDDRLIAVERISSYGFGRSISERQFRSQHLHMISIPLNVGLSQGSWDGYGGVRMDYLSGVRGTVSVDSESSVTSVNSWMKEYGYNRFSLDAEIGLMKNVSRNLGLGLRLGYQFLSRYNVDYFNNSNLQLNNKRDINISLQLQYDLIR